MCGSGRVSGVTDQAIEIVECLAQSFPQVLELSDALAAVSEKLIDPFKDDRAAHLIQSPALDFFDFAVGEHGEDTAKVPGCRFPVKATVIRRPIGHAIASRTVGIE